MTIAIGSTSWCGCWFNCCCKGEVINWSCWGMWLVLGTCDLLGVFCRLGGLSDKSINYTAN